MQTILAWLSRAVGLISLQWLLSFERAIASRIARGVDVAAAAQRFLDLQRQRRKKQQKHQRWVITSRNGKAVTKNTAKQGPKPKWDTTAKAKERFINEFVCITTTATEEEEEEGASGGVAKTSKSSKQEW
jgi:hypothetical protein